MKKIAKLQIKLFQSDTYRAMLAKYGAPGALLIVRLQVMEQAGPLPDFTDERQLLILSTEIGSDAPTTADMLATLRQWQTTDNEPSKDTQPMSLKPQPEPEPESPQQAPHSRRTSEPCVPTESARPSLKKPNPKLSRRKERRRLRQKLRALKREARAPSLR